MDNFCPTAARLSRLKAGRPLTMAPLRSTVGWGTTRPQQGWTDEAYCGCYPRPLGIVVFRASPRFRDAQAPLSVLTWP